LVVAAVHYPSVTNSVALGSPERLADDLQIAATARAQCGRAAGASAAGAVAIRIQGHCTDRAGARSACQPA